MPSVTNDPSLQSVNMLNVVMLNVIMLNVIMLNVVMLNVWRRHGCVANA